MTKKGEDNSSLKANLWSNLVSSGNDLHSLNEPADLSCSWHPIESITVLKATAGNSYSFVITETILECQHLNIPNDCLFLAVTINQARFPIGLMRFFTGQMLSLVPNRQLQSTEVSIYRQNCIEEQHQPHLSFLYKIGDHHNTSTVFLPDHPPHVLNRPLVTTCMYKHQHSRQMQIPCLTAGWVKVKR